MKTRAMMRARENVKTTSSMRANSAVKNMGLVRATQQLKTTGSMRAGDGVKTKKMMRAKGHLKTMFVVRATDGMENIQPLRAKIFMKTKITVPKKEGNPMELQEIALELRQTLKDYEGLTKLCTQVSNRARAMGIDPSNYDLLTGVKTKEGKVKFQGLQQIRERMRRQLLKIVENYPLWDAWLSKIPGIGPRIAAGLIWHYYFRCYPVCPACGGSLTKEDHSLKCEDCGKKAKGDGNLKLKVELRDFPTISSWWHHMGRHVVDGKMPKRQKGVGLDTDVMRWSQSGRQLGYLIRQAFTKAKEPKYGEYYRKRLEYRMSTHPDESQAHRVNMAWNETIKLFLAHFWQVARTIDGLPLTEPWVFKFGGHDEQSIIPPYYWESQALLEEEKIWSYG